MAHLLPNLLPLDPTQITSEIGRKLASVAQQMSKSLPIERKRLTLSHALHVDS